MENNSDTEKFVLDQKLGKNPLWLRILLDVRFRVSAIAFLTVLLTLSLPVLLNHTVWYVERLSNPECLLPYHMRLNCLPDQPNGNLSEDICKNVSCCWDNDTISAPHCFYSYASDLRHQLTDVINKCDKNGDGELKRVVINMHYAPSTTASLYNRTKPVKHVRVSLDIINSNILQIKFVSDELATFDFERYLGRTGRSHVILGNCSKTVNDSDNNFKIALPKVGKPFSLVILRREPKPTEVFNTFWAPIIFHEQFMELTTFPPSKNLYGLGEGPHMTLRHNLSVKRTWPLFAQHRNLSDAEGGWYGAHPFYLCMENDGKAHGLLVTSGNPMDVTITATPSVTFRNLGSSFHFHVLLGPTPNDVIRQLTEIVGKPAFPPYWALGRHDCRTESSSDDDGPIESICFWATQDDKWRDRARDARSKGLKVMLVETPHVIEGLAIDESAVINGSFGSFLEVFDSDTTKWLKNRYNNLADSFDGVMLTMNTPFTDKKDHCVDNRFNRPPYNPLGAEQPLSQNTICMEACHSKDGCQSGVGSPLHYNLHNIYGMTHAGAVYSALNNNKSRPFVTSLSTFPGSGRYGGHWGGELASDWSHLKMALVQALEFNMYGIPLTGAPACGFWGKNKSPDVCSRWWQMAAFQPLLLSHRRSGDAGMTDKNMVSTITNAVYLRYPLLPYLYTLMYDAHVHGSAVMRPLFFEFPLDKNTYGIDEQFMWGSGLLISPVIKNDTGKDMPAYIPKGCWYDINDGKLAFRHTSGAFKNLSGLEYMVNLHIRGGSVIPIQREDSGGIEKSRENPLQAYVALECLGRQIDGELRNVAQGYLFLDDGRSPLEKTQYFEVKFTAQRQDKTLWLLSEPLDENAARNFKVDGTNVTLDSLYVMGLQDEPRECEQYRKNDTIREEVKPVPKDIYLNMIIYKHLEWDLREKNKIKCTI